jgi:hypothetical protein
MGLGLKREPRWDRLLNHLSKPTVSDGVYAAIETPPYTVPEDHPSMLAAFGMLPLTPLIDPEPMRRTLEHVMKTWDWPSTWGWDYPVIAMTAARVGRPDLAVDALLMDVPKNTYLPNGHNYQRRNLPLYLPGNGGLLAATAMMAAGWGPPSSKSSSGTRGSGNMQAPGFPAKGWCVRWEDLQPLP